MNIIVFTDDELKSLRFILKEHYGKTPDGLTKNILTKIADPKEKYQYTKGKEL